MEFHKIVRNFSRLLQLVFYLFLFISYLNTGPFFFSFCFSILSPFFSTIQTTDYIVACRFDWKIFSLERAFYGWKVATINLFIFLFYSLTLLFFASFFIHTAPSPMPLFSVYLLSPFKLLSKHDIIFSFCAFFLPSCNSKKKNAIWQAEKRRLLKSVERLHFFPNFNIFLLFFLLR